MRNNANNQAWPYIPERGLGVAIDRSILEKTSNRF
jgi:hypothetical protein